ncbi:MAG: inositol monophosphatase family protein [Gammaproteobacteria bacterium]|nr:inositol monophosphatase family protein [Gammaproteobacteria bacterium]
MPYFEKSASRIKHDGSIITDADLAMQASLTTALQAQFAHVGMLSEEMSVQQQLQELASDGDYWCLDPLDGTTNFHATTPLFSVSLALVSNHSIVLGLVYDPLREEFFSALRGQGFWINRQHHKPPQQPELLSQSIAFVDFKRLKREDRLRLAEQAPYKSQRNIGSCALEWAWLAAGRVQLLIHGSENLWDYAAGSLLLEEAGGISQSHVGDAVFSESLEPRSILAASNPELFRQWSSWYRQP